jgi:hypothetical protein
METVVIRIDMPAKGIEITGEGFAPTDDQIGSYAPLQNWPGDPSAPGRGPRNA